jgi:uncharacterized protein YndB with AHSA1/START domain
VRREILWLLWAGELTAGEIASGFDITAGTISTHLNALVDAGLVHRRVDGTFRRYRVDRQAMAAVRPLLAGSEERWQKADDLPERDLAEAEAGIWVTVATTVPLDRDTAFASFADAERYSEFLGVPVTIADGRFQAEMEWGTRVRGNYEVVAPPDLIAMRWDFEDQATPLPGWQLVGYLRFFDDTDGCRVEVHQAAGDRTQAEYLTAAWSMVLGRFTEHAGGVHRPPREHRPKRRDPEPSPDTA